MRKLLGLVAGAVLAVSIFSTSAEARVYGSVYVGVPAASVWVGPGYYGPNYYRPYYYRSAYYGPYRHYYRPYRHYWRHYRHW